MPQCINRKKLEDVGGIAMGLVSDLARNLIGSIAYVDAGYDVMS
jgi:enoyl-[acyl-carrier-protein] reductase (NADH)